jgi:hypothetical protein
MPFEAQLCSFCAQWRVAAVFHIECTERRAAVPRNEATELGSGPACAPGWSALGCPSRNRAHRDDSECRPAAGLASTDRRAVRLDRASALRCRPNRDHRALCRQDPGPMIGEFLHTLCQVALIHYVIPREDRGCPMPSQLHRSRANATRRRPVQRMV